MEISTQLPTHLIPELTFYNSVVAVFTGALNNHRPESRLSEENIMELNDILSQTLQRIQNAYNS